jgi:hypothetical protein
MVTLPVAIRRPACGAGAAARSWRQPACAAAVRSVGRPARGVRCPRHGVGAGSARVLWSPDKAVPERLPIGPRELYTAHATSAPFNTGSRDAALQHMHEHYHQQLNAWGAPLRQRRVEHRARPRTCMRPASPMRSAVSADAPASAGSTLAGAARHSDSCARPRAQVARSATTSAAAHRRLRILREPGWGAVGLG